MSAWSDLGPTAPSRMEVFAQAFELMRLATLARDLTSAGPGQDVPRAIRTLDQARALLSPGSSFPPATREDGEAVCEACGKPCHEDRLHIDGNGFIACAAAFTDDGSGDCPHSICEPSNSAPVFAGVNLETVIATSLAGGNDVQPYEIAIAVRAALATTRPAPEQAPDYPA